MRQGKLGARKGLGDVFRRDEYEDSGEGDRTACRAKLELAQKWREIAQDLIAQCRPGHTPPSLMESAWIATRSDPLARDIAERLRTELEACKKFWKKSA